MVLVDLQAGRPASPTFVLGHRVPTLVLPVGGALQREHRLVAVHHVALLRLGQRLPGPTEAHPQGRHPHRAGRAGDDLLGVEVQLPASPAHAFLGKPEIVLQGGVDGWVGHPLAKVGPDGCVHLGKLGRGEDGHRVAGLAAHRFRVVVPGGVEAAVLPYQLPHTGLGGGLGAGWECRTAALLQSWKPPGQMAVPLKLFHDERPLLVSLPVTLLLQDGAEADLGLRLGLVTISGRDFETDDGELPHPNPSQCDVGRLADNSSLSCIKSIFGYYVSRASGCDRVTPHF